MAKSSLQNSSTILGQSIASDTGNLSKLHKVRSIGEDIQGNQYQSLEQMWKSQLDPRFID